MKNLPSISSEGLEFHLAQKNDRQWFIDLYTDSDIMGSIPGGVMSEARAKETAEQAISQSLNDGLGYYVFRTKGEKSAAGYVVLRPFTWDKRFSGIELGYILAKEFWKKGLAYKAASIMTNYARQILHKERLIALVNNNNTGSIRIVEKIGFIRMPQAPLDYPDNSIWILE